MASVDHEAATPQLPTFKEVIEEAPTYRRFGRYSHYGGFEVDEVPLYPVESVETTSLFSAPYGRVISHLAAELTQGESLDVLKSYDEQESRVLKNLIRTPIRSALFGLAVGAGLTPVALSLVLRTLTFRPPAVLSLAAGLWGGFVGFQSGLQSTTRLTLEAALALPEQSKLRKRTLEIFELPEVDAVNTPLYMLYGSPSISDSSRVQA